MPLFPQGQDPLDAGTPSPLPSQVSTAPAPQDPQPPPAFADTLSAAFRQSNPVASVLDAVISQSPNTRLDPDFNALADIKGTKYQPYAAQFYGMPNADSANGLKAQIDREDQDRLTLSSSGWAGTVASVGAGLLDPTFYLPIFGGAREASALASAARTAAMGALQSTASEALLSSSQATRSPSESFGNIATNTLLMGVLGGALGHLNPAEHADLAAATEEARPRMTIDPVTGTAAPADAPMSAGIVNDNAVTPADAAEADDFMPTDPVHKRIMEQIRENDGVYDPLQAIKKQSRLSLSSLVKSGDRLTSPYLHPDGGVYSTGGDHSTFADGQQRLDSGLVRIGYGQGDAEGKRNLFIDLVDGQGVTQQQVSTLGRLAQAHRGARIFYETSDLDGNALSHVEGGPEIIGTLPVAGVKPNAESVGNGASTASGLAQPTGAAATDTREMQPKSYGLNTVAGIEQLANSVSPNQFIYHSGSIEAKRALADLASTATRFEQHDAGIPTSLNGSNLEDLISVQQNQLLLKTHDILEDTWSRHYYPDGEPGTIKLAAGKEGIGAPTQGDKLSYSDFKSAVYDAGTQGDVHPVPEVQEAMQRLRSEVLDPTKQFAQQTLGPDGRPMLAEELDAPAGDQSFMPRQPVHDAMTSKYYETKQAIANWLQGEQADKAAAKDRLTDLQSRHEALGQQVDKLEGRLDTIRGKQEETTTRLSERANAMSQSADRFDTVEARTDTVKGGLDELDEFLGAMKDQAHGPETKARLDELEQQRDLLRGQMTGMSRADKAAVEQSELSSLRDLKSNRVDIREAVAAGRQDRGRLRRRLTTASARQDEAAIAARSNAGRMDLLQDRLGRQQMIEDLLEAARNNAEDERGALRGKMEDEIRGWKGNSSAEAMAALKTRDEAMRVRGLKDEAGISSGRGQRLTSADGPIDRAVKHIIASNRDMPRQELESRADEIMGRYIGSPDGRIPYDAASGGPNVGFTGGPKHEVRGSLKSRDFAMPTSMFPAGVINKDVEHVIASHLRTILPDVHLTARFGDVDMENVFRKINEEYAAKIGPDTTEAKSKAIFAERDKVIEKLAAVRDRLRGVHGWTPSPTARKLGSMVRDFQNVAALSGLGTSVLNRLSDIGANAVFRYGLSNVFHDIWTPLFKAMTGDPTLLKMSKQQARDGGVGVNGLLGHMRENLHDVNASYMPGNKFSRGLAWATDKSMLVNMHGPWTDYMQALNWSVAQGEFGRVAKRVAEGGGTKSDLQRMADANITPDMTRRISAQYEAHQIEVQGRKFADTGSWTDSAARQAFEAAMSREAKINVIQAGIGDKPLWMSTQLGGLIGQFKSFTAGAHEKILISNLQQRDGRSLQGALFSVMMGMLSYRLYTIAAGQEVSSNPADWIKEGIHRSAMPGWLTEANQTISKFTSGRVDYNRLYGAGEPMTRRQSNSPMGDMLGPTYARLEGLAGVGTHMFAGKGSAQDIHQIRTALPLQNLMGFRRLFDDVEDSTANAFGLTPRKRSGPQWVP